MKIDVSHIAKLASLPVTDAEKKKLETQLSETLTYIKQLEEIDTKGIKPTSQVTNLENVTRSDVAVPSLTQEESLSNAKATHNGFFKVSAILTNDL